LLQESAVEPLALMRHFGFHDVEAFRQAMHQILDSGMVRLNEKGQLEWVNG
jgi:hypothetical protein